jgi:hypothetical protein
MVEQGLVDRLELGVAQRFAEVYTKYLGAHARGDRTNFNLLCHDQGLYRSSAIPAYAYFGNPGQPSSTPAIDACVDQ